MKRCLFVAFSAACFPAFISTAPAQTLAGEIDITVVDASGAVVPAARVSVSKAGTAGVIRNVLTSSDGMARIPLLDAGSYDIAVDAAGFSRLIQSGVTVGVAQVVRLELGLTAGSVSESITVIGQTPQLEEKSSALGQVYDQRQLLDLPLNGRNYLDLGRLSAGAIPSRGRLLWQTMRPLYFFFVFAIAAAPVLSAQSRGKSRWISLFDGKTFAGWDDPGTRTPRGDSWAIEDGCLMSRPKPRIREDLFTTSGFGDFELEWDWRIEPSGNSGLKYGVQHSEFFDFTKVSTWEIQTQMIEQMEKKISVREKLAPTATAKEYVIGFEYQMIDDTRHADAKADPRHACGSLYGMVAPTRAMARPAGEWNHSRVVYRGGSVEHWLNGVRIVEASLNAPGALKGLEERWGLQHPVYRFLSERPRKRTPIVLQNHSSRAWFKNLRIREL